MIKLPPDGVQAQCQQRNWVSSTAQFLSRLLTFMRVEPEPLGVWENEPQ